MAWSFSEGKAVYLQIAERITVSILSGKYLPSEQLPSVRQLALEAAVNPNTVQHAFCELEDDGIIVSKGTPSVSAQPIKGTVPFIWQMIR